MKYIAAACILQIVWSLTPSASNIVLQQISVELYTALRWTLSGFIFLAFTIVKYGGLQSSRKEFLPISLLGILGYGLASIGTLYGLKTGGVVNFALVGSISPIVTALVAIIVLKESFNRYYVLAAGICVVGLLTLVLGKYQISSFEVAATSAAFIFGAYFLEGLPFVYSKKFTNKVPLVGYMAIAQLAAAGFMWVSQLVWFKQFDELSQASMKTWMAMGFVAVISCALCYFVLYWLLNHMEGHKLALFDGLHTVFAALFGFLLFQEQFNSTMLFGGGLLLMGLYLANSKVASVIEDTEVNADCTSAAPKLHLET